MKHLKVYENWTPCFTKFALNETVLNDGEYLVFSLFWAGPKKLFLSRVCTPSYDSTTPNFKYNKLKTFEPEIDDYEIEIYQDMKSGRFYHPAGIGVNGVENPKYEYIILYRGNNYNDAKEQYDILSNSKKFGI